MIHYPTDRVNGMIDHLASLSDEKLIISFAPKTLAYTILKRIGELFPGPSKATRAYLHAEEDVEAALNAAGFKVTRREMTATSFYFSRLLECARVNSSPEKRERGKIEQLCSRLIIRRRM
jgi:magnesium-protoporphyrin O-methyltransferase